MRPNGDARDTGRLLDDIQHIGLMLDEIRDRISNRV